MQTFVQLSTHHLGLSRSINILAQSMMVYSKDDLDIGRNGTPCRHMSTTPEDMVVSSDVTEPAVGLKAYSQMPGPKGWPLIGSLWDYLKKDGYRFNKMFEAMHDLSQIYGPVYREKIALISHVVVSDPTEYVKVIRVDGKHPHRTELEPLAHYRNQRNMCLGTVNSQGEEWHRHRAVVSKKTLRPKEVMAYIPEMNDVGNDFIKHLTQLRSSEGRIPDLEMELFRWAFESICTFLFDERMGCFEACPPEQAQRFVENLVGFFKYLQPLMYNVPIYKLYPTKTWRLFENHADTVTEIGLQYIQKKMATLEEEQDGSLLTYLLKQKSLSAEEAVSHVLDMMVGGVETVSNAFLWTLYLLAKNPDAQETLHKETLHVLAESDGQITDITLAKLSYVKACLKETFRLYPITFATSRFVKEDIELGGYHVPAGTHVQANLYGMGRNPDLFTDPLAYRPERWLRENKDGPGQSLASLPWGHGPRMCIGRRLAEQEIYIAVTKFIQHFRVEHESEFLPVLNTVMTPDRPVEFVFKPRPRPLAQAQSHTGSVTIGRNEFD